MLHRKKKPLSYAADGCNATARSSTVPQHNSNTDYSLKPQTKSFFVCEFDQIDLWDFIWDVFGWCESMRPTVKTCLATQKHVS